MSTFVFYQLESGFAFIFSKAQFSSIILSLKVSIISAKWLSPKYNTNVFYFVFYSTERYFNQPEIYFYITALSNILSTTC